MFTSLGLFKNTPCPLDGDCLLVNCIFNHRTTNSDEVYAPSAVAERLLPPPSKRRRVEDKAKPASGWAQSAGAVRNSPGGGSAEDLVARLPDAHSSQVKTEPPGNHSSKNSHNRLQASVSTRKSVSPPPTRRAASPVLAKVKESLNPRTIPHPPQKHEKRRALLMTLHAAMAKLNGKTLPNQEVNKSSVLSVDELISMANDEEERMALTTKDEDSYRTIMGQRVMRLRKMEATEWTELVLEHFKKALFKQTSAKGMDVEQPRVKMEERPSKELKNPDKAELVFSTTLNSEQEIALLQHTRTPVEDLADYVTKPPSEIEVANAQQALETSRGLEVCDRCKSRFTVFPGRNEEGKLTSGRQCHYHWAKLPKFAPDATYECCHKPAGAEPCETAKTHVFKVTNPSRLASILQFEETPKQKDKMLKPAVSVDCEMGFTTLGMEMIRLSALSWPEGEEILDVLVRPIGEVLDLNTRFSGVSLDQFNKAIPYGTQQADHGDSTSEEGELEPERLQKVESPEAARKLLFDQIGPDTALIGHAIDNDLNVLRVIHPFIVDTVLLYPHPRGLPTRYGLKMLTNKYLHRNIQDRHTGHDSKEDAKATGELVRLKVDEKWKKMRSDGWTFDNGRLIPPEVSDLPTKPPKGPNAVRSRTPSTLDGAGDGEREA